MIPKCFLFILSFLIFSGCDSENIIIVNPPVDEETDNIENLLERLENSNGSDVMVVAHRAVWEDAPENSIKSIEAAIDLGVDMVELDIRMTQDGILILMHDEAVDRMTDGTGKVSDLTLQQIKQLKLRNRNGGAITGHSVPTFKEAMLAAKDKILVRVDKAHSIGIVDEVIDDLIATETVDHACFVVSQAYQAGNVAFEWPEALETVYFSPGVDADGNGGPAQVNGYLNYPKVVAVESSFSDDENITIDWADIKSRGARIMVYTGNSGSCGGHDDDISLINIDEGFGWLIERGVNMIQTDEPRFLLNYLRIEGLHE